MFQPSCRHPSLQSDTGGTVFFVSFGRAAWRFSFLGHVWDSRGVAFSGSCEPRSRMQLGRWPFWDGTCVFGTDGPAPGLLQLFPEGAGYT